MTISLDQAVAIVTGALEHASQIDAAPLAVAVLDPGGHVVALHRQDGAGILRPQIASGKAWSALGMGMSTRKLAGLAEQLPTFVGAVASLDNAALLPVPGGVLIHDEAGALLGAVGISGDVSEVDERCALHGIEQAGLRSGATESS